MSQRLESVAVSRRKLLRGVGAALVAMPVSRLLGCGGGTSSDGGALDGSTDAVATGDAAAAVDSALTADTSSIAWATGGTAAMTATYPDPFATGLGSTCNLTCSATLGPCYAQTVERQDISEGHDGLPTRLAFLLVDESCQPIQGATVDIWHAAPEGLYSGSDASTFCTANDPTATSARWFRGVQTTDANGRVDFNTCFPGWYSGRTIHIHFTIRINGVEYVTSQLFFDDSLDDDIVDNQPLYNTRGARDTTNQNDTVISASAVGEYTFQTAKMSDGALLAWKTLVIRSSTSETLCSVPGGTVGGGGGAMGGPPDGGGPMGAPPDAGNPVVDSGASMADATVDGE